MASWKLPKDPGKDHYASAVLSRIKTFEKPVQVKLDVTTQMYLNVQTVKGNRHAVAHTTKQLQQYRDVVKKHLKGMLQEIDGFEAEYKKYVAYLKPLKRKPDKKVVKQRNKLHAAMKQLKTHVLAIEAHAKR